MLVHPGGPFWAKKNDKAWGIVKGEFEEGEDPFGAAKREFKEEIGHHAPHGHYYDLGNIEIPGKIIYCWAVEHNLNESKIKSNNFKTEWPPRSGQIQEFPEVDQAKWFPVNKAYPKMHTGQEKFLELLADVLDFNLEKPEQSSLF